jgi:hypothetical protein
MKEHLSLLDDAFAQIASAHRRFASQSSLAATQKTRLSELAAAVRELAGAIEKLLKHALVARHQFLIFDRLEREEVLRLVRAELGRSAPTLITEVPDVKTIGLEACWATAKEFFAPELEELNARGVDRERFAATLRELVKRRNRAQHGELWEEPQALLALMKRMLSQIRHVGACLVPEFEARLAADHDRLRLALVAIEQEVEKGWVELLEALRLGTVLPLEVELWTKFIGEAGDIHLLAGEVKGADAHLVVNATVGQDRATGVFARMAEADPFSDRRRLQEAGLILEDDGAELVGQLRWSVRSPSWTNLGFGSPVADDNGLAASIRAHMERKRAAVERQGLAQIEGGALYLAGLPGWLQWGPGLGAPVASVLIEGAIRYMPGERVGRVDGHFAADPSYPGAARQPLLKVEGTIRMTSEAAHPASDDEGPAGSIAHVRRHLASLTVSLE